MAKAPSLADNLGKHLECAVCLEQYTEPKVLPCLHSFCKRCLQGLLIQEGAIWMINCPTCRSNAEIPQGQIDLLPVNFFVNNLVSMLTLHQDSEGSNLECDNCGSGDPPVSRCITCLHFLCEFCTQAHQRGRNTRSHNLISLEEAKKMGSVAVTKPSFCNEHEGEVIKLFCKTCEQAICRDCTVMKHRDHKYTLVKDAFSGGKESLLKILSETKTKASLLKEAVDDVVEMKKNVNACAEQTVQEIINCFNELSACLDARRGELVDKVEEFNKAKLKSLEIQQEELETALGSVQSSVEFTERALESGSEVEILNMCKQISNRLQDLNSVKWQLEPCVDDGLKFKSGNRLRSEIATFGAVTDLAAFAGELEEYKKRNAGRRKKEARKISSSSQSEFEDSGPEEDVNMNVNQEQMEVDDDDDVDEEGANGYENRKGNSENEKKTSNKTYGKGTGQNLEGIHARYEGVLRILQDRKLSLAKAMDRYGIARNTLRDFLGICELRILDEERYKSVVGKERKCTGKPSVKVIERRCRSVLAEYKVQSQRLKEEKKLLPFFPAESFYK